MGKIRVWIKRLVVTNKVENAALKKRLEELEARTI